MVRGVPFRGVARKNVTKTLRGAVLCNLGPICVGEREAKELIKTTAGASGSAMKASVCKLSEPWAVAGA